MAKSDPKYVTKQMLDSAVDAILGGMDSLFEKFRGDMDARFEKVETRLAKVESRLDRVGIELSHVKDTVEGLKAELSDTPSRREFEELKARVDKYHPVV